MTIPLKRASRAQSGLGEAVLSVVADDLYTQVLREAEVQTTQFAKRAQRSLNLVASDFVVLGKSARGAAIPAIAGQFDNLGESAGISSRRVRTLGSSAVMLGSTMSTLPGPVGAAASAVTDLGLTFAFLGRSMWGPVGVIIGFVTTLGFIAKAIHKSNEEAEDAAKAFKEWQKSAQELGDTLRKNATESAGRSASIGAIARGGAAVVTNTEREQLNKLTQDRLDLLGKISAAQEEIDRLPAARLSPSVWGTLGIGPAKKEIGPPAGTAEKEALLRQHIKSAQLGLKALADEEYAIRAQAESNLQDLWDKSRDERLAKDKAVEDARLEAWSRAEQLKWQMSKANIEENAALQKRLYAESPTGKLAGAIVTSQAEQAQRMQLESTLTWMKMMGFDVGGDVRKRLGLESPLAAAANVARGGAVSPFEFMSRADTGGGSGVGAAQQQQRDQTKAAAETAANTKVMVDLLRRFTGPGVRN